MLAQEAKETHDTATVHLKGRVVDEDQSPVEFATVRVEGQPIGTTTDLNGQYRLSFKTADSVAILYNMSLRQQHSMHQQMYRWEKLCLAIL